MDIYSKKAYYEHHGNLEIPDRFKTINGYKSDENGVNLGTWIKTQRISKKDETLLPEREELLTKIGMLFEANDAKWNKMYELAKAYYENHGNLEIPQRFKTTNGYEPDEKGVNLGTWINTQRQSEKNKTLLHEREVLLTKIGMVWDIKKNKEEISNICKQYNIDTNINKTILNHISTSELTSKILFLMSNNIDITSNKGKLHEIFSMSSSNIFNKYNITLEQLIEEYYINNKER